MDEKNLEMETPVQTPVDQSQQQPVMPDATTMQLYHLNRTMANGGGWFYWIAALSLANSLATLFKLSFSFPVGLGATMIVDAIVSNWGGMATAIGVPISLFLIGLYGMFGYFAVRRHRWAFIAGLICYGLDALLILGLAFAASGIGSVMFTLAFHAWAILGIVQGFKAETAMRQIESKMQNNL